MDHPPAHPQAHREVARRMFLRLPMFVLILAAVAVAAAAQSPEAAPIDGPRFPARLTGIDETWRITFDAGGQSRTVSGGDLLMYGQPAAEDRGAQILLANGGVILGELVKADAERLTFSSVEFDDAALPIELLAGVVLRPAAALPRRDAFAERVLRAAGDADRVILANGDELTGAINGVEETDKGTVLELETPAGKTRFPLERIAAFVFNPALRPPAKAAPELRAWIGLRDGSRLLAAACAVDKGQAKITVAKGATLTADAGRLVWLQPLGGRVTYLSDLPPVEHRHTPYLDIGWPYRNDRQAVGGLLRHAGRMHSKGLGVHSRSLLVYDVPPGTTRFEAEAAVDDIAGRRGSVVFRVQVDGAAKYASPTLRGGQPAAAVNVDLKNARRLSLEVDFADQGDELDYADWLSARFVR